MESPGELALERVNAGGGLEVTRQALYDLSTAAPGASATIPVRVKNLGPGPLTLEAVDRLTGDDVFRLELTAGTVLAAGETLSLNAIFTPPADASATLSAFQAGLRVTASGTIEGGGVVMVDLQGLTGTPSFTWSPATLDFGYGPPGTPVSGEITFSNRSFFPVQLSAITVRSGSASEPFTSESTELTVPPARRDTSAANGIAPGLATLRLGFRPTVLGPRAGQLTATTDFPLLPSIAVNLRGVGGGPDIDVRPTVLAFGQIPYFAGATPPSFAQRRLTVQNVGTRPTPPDPRANLKLGQPDGVGGFVRPYWQVRALAGSSLNEICVGTFDAATGTCLNDLSASSYDPAVGLEAGGTTSSLVIPVRITPEGLGTRRFEISLYSNDLDEPVTVITVTADAVSLPPCDIEVSPGSLAFGLLAAPTTRELSFTVRNRLTGPNDLCRLSSLELLGGTPAVFSLAEAPFDELDLQPGQSKHIVVRASPRGPMPAQPTQALGTVSFHIASPIASLVALPLSATLAVPCLSVFPAQFDFGTVSTSCSSAERAFQLFNTCSTDVVIDAATSSGANAFSVVSGLSPGTRVPAGGTAPVTFSISYRPTNQGPDFGVFRLRVTENGAAQEYPVPLKGQGDLLGLNTEQFLQTTRSRADVLMVIDDSSSMGPRQTALAQSVLSLLQVAALRNVDFQLGVTNTELAGATAAKAGTLHATNDGVRIVRPFTVNLQAAASELMHVGTSGSVESCMEPATRALTAPYITDLSKNAGFLREDASLHVICVTDARDQAPRTPAVYLNQLLNLKGAQRAGQFTYDVIGPFHPVAPSGCVYDDPNDGAHDFMVAQSGGVKEEICTSNWSATLLRIGQHLFDDRTAFALVSRPDLGAAIEVTIDGLAIPPVDPDPNLMTPIWNYDLISNAIVFESRYVPEPGRTVRVSYRAACVP